MTPPFRQVRARYDDESITVYQAYDRAIAGPAVAAGTFVAPFKNERMTWIKPSFLWMMYRCGWATKPGQDCVLAIELPRAAFDSFLLRASLSHFEAGTHASHMAWEDEKRRCPVRVQWDPERDLQLEPLPWRSIQIGLSGPVVGDYLAAITSITDLTSEVNAIRAVMRDDGSLPAHERLPSERPYPMPAEAAATLGATPA